jgi:hypothetical protein
MDDKNQFNETTEIVGNIKLRLDKDLKKLLKTSEKTGVPLIFSGDSIVDFKVEGDSRYESNIKPDFIEIGPPAFYFDLEFGGNKFKDVPFDRIKTSDHTYVFKSMPYSTLDIDFDIGLRLDNLNLDPSLTITIHRKSNKIKDILNYEIRKRELSNGTFSLIPFGDLKFKMEGKLPSASFDDDILDFYKKVNHINDELKLNIALDDDYVITNDDFISANIICDFIKNKKIKLDTLPLSMNTSIFGLNKLLIERNKQFTLKQNEYCVNLIGNEINLGSYKIELKHYEIVNFDELNEIYINNQNSKDLISINVVLKEKDSDELYMDFD